MPSRDDRDTTEATTVADESTDSDDEDPAASVDGELTAADVERIARRVVREELDGADRSGDSSPWTVLAGVVVGFAVLLPVSALALSSLLDLGFPVQAVGALGLLASLALVAYGWRLPPFR